MITYHYHLSLISSRLSFHNKDLYLKQKNRLFQDLKTLIHKMENRHVLLASWTVNPISQGGGVSDTPP